MKKMILYLGIVVAGVVVYLVLSASSTTIPRPRIKIRQQRVYHDPFVLPYIEFSVHSYRASNEKL